jgi:hydrophobic/amphiphilic exporter-1 (mainly G- bacteria), HAE1 family
MSLIEFSTRRRVSVLMFTITMVLFGLISWSSLKVNLLPDLSYPTLTVRTEYTGAAPSEIENLVTEPVEEAVGVVKGLSKLHSISRPGQSDVVLEFAWGTDMDQASLDVREKLENLNLPLDVLPPVLLRFNPSTEPIVRLVLSVPEGFKGDVEAELIRLRRYADDELKKSLEPVDGVAAVKVGGGLEDEVQVRLDERRLAQLNLPASTVIDRLAQENVNISGGRIAEGNERYLVRTVNQFRTLDEMRDMLINVQNGVPIRLRDVAQVEQSHKEREAMIRLRGSEAVELAIYKEGDSNAVTVAHAVRARLAQLQKAGEPVQSGKGGGDQAAKPKPVTALPDGEYVLGGYTLRTIQDTSIFIENAIHEVRNEAIIGGFLAILIIFIFLRDGWSTLVISLSLPVSIITTFFFMDQLDLSLNVMSLAGLALATGMVVDDSIVVLESIAKARERGLGILQAAITGTKEVSMAVVASTLTTVAVFFPLVFVQGVAGQLFKDQALTVSIAMVISLVVSLTLIPMLSSVKAKAPMAFAEETELTQPVWRSAVAFFLEVFKSPLKWWRWFLNAIRTPAKTAFSGIFKKPAVLIAGLLLIVVGLPVWILCTIIAGLVIPVFFVFPYISAFFINIYFFFHNAGRNYVGPVAVKLSEIVIKPYDFAAKRYHEILPGALQRPWLVLGSATLAFVISLGLLATLGADLIPQLAQDRFEMTARLPSGTRLSDTDTLVRAFQKAHQNDPEIKALYGVSGTGTRLDASPTESGENIAKLMVVLNNYSPEREALVTDRMRATAAKYPGVEVKFGRPQLLSFSSPLEIEIRGSNLPAIEKAARRLAERMQQRPQFADVKTTVQEGYPEIQILFDQERAAALGLTDRQISDQVVRQVRGEVATRYSFRDRKIDVRVRARETDRSSVEAIRNLVVNPQSENPVTLGAVADVKETLGPSEINRVEQDRVAIVSSNLRDVDLGSAVAEVRRLVKEEPLGTEIQLSFGGQSEELDASRLSLMFAFGLAIFLVYLVMASQFESLLHPFVIMFSVPLAIVGAALALFIVGSPVSVVVFIGLILLVGIVVKNAIVLIDKVNQLRDEGVAKRKAICDAAESRLRPIIMTTLTTLFGFAPLAFFTGEGAEVRQPMAITVIGGLIVSTLLTLVVIPVVYDLMDRRGDAWYRERGRRHRGELEAQALDTEEGIA